MVCNQKRKEIGKNKKLRKLLKLPWFYACYKINLIFKNNDNDLNHNFGVLNNIKSFHKSRRDAKATFFYLLKIWISSILIIKWNGKNFNYKMMEKFKYYFNK